MSPSPTNSSSPAELERLRRAFQAHSEEIPDPANCPAPQELWDAVNSALDTARIQELIEHTATCPSCAEEWRLARDMAQDVESHEEEQPEEEPESEGVVISAAHRFRRSVTPFIGLAAAAAALFLVLRPPQTEAPAPVYRAGAEQEIESLVPSDQALPRDAFVLQWSEIDGAVYGLLISAADLEVIDQPQDLDTNTYQVPADLLESVEGTIYWQVEATLPDGTSKTSKTFVQAIEGG